MAIVFESDSANEGNTTGLVVTKPTGTVDGDVLFCFWISRANHSDGQMTLPSGWTQTSFDGGQNPSIKTAYKVASSEGADYTFTTNVARLQGAWIGRFSGVDTTTPTDGTTVNTNAVTLVTDLTISAITTNTNGAFTCFAFGTPYGSSYDLTPPSGFTEMEDYLGASCVNMNVSYYEQATAGSSGDKTGTCASTVTGMVGALFAIKPAASAATSLPPKRRTNTLVRM